jgi:hypothetical protein
MNPVFTFSRKVKDDQGIRRLDIPDVSDIGKLDGVIQKLETLPKVSRYSLHEIGLRTNPKKWVCSLLASYPDKVNAAEMENLLIDFTDTMKTRMREESKYAIGLLMGSGLILCHSTFGEETITPEWKIIPRMLDVDNILRYVWFAEENGHVSVKFWEREATSSFTEWLGLSRKQAFQFGGKFRIISEVEGITTEFQLTEQEIEAWMNAHSEFKEGKIKFSSPVSVLAVTEIRVGGKRYQTTEDFIQDYEAEKYGVPQYNQEYEKIKAKNLPLLIKYFDEKTQLVRKEGDEEAVQVMKATPSFDIIFADGEIELRASYLSDIATRFINGESVKVFHAGLKFRLPPFALGKLEVYNDVSVEPLARWTAEYYNRTNLQDRNLDILLRYVCVRLLAFANAKLPIAYLLESLSAQIARELDLQGKLTKFEDTIIEYKSSDVLAGGNDQIAEALGEDLRNKLQTCLCKIYIIGVEDDGTVNPILASRLKSDRIESIKNAIQNETGFGRLFAFPVVRGEKALLILIALSR